MARTGLSSPIGVVRPEDICFYRFVHFAPGIITQTTIRSVDGVRMENIIAAYVDQPDGDGGDRIGIEGLGLKDWKIIGLED